MSFKTIAGGFNGAFWWYGPLSKDQEIYQNIKTVRGSPEHLPV